MSDVQEIDARRVYVGPVTVWYRAAGQEIVCLWAEEDGETIFCYHCDKGVTCFVHEPLEPEDADSGMDLEGTPGPKRAKTEKKKDGSSDSKKADDG